jgi:FixJ family two-component response regulator
MLDLESLEFFFHSIENYLNINQDKILEEIDMYLRVIDNLKSYLLDPSDFWLSLPFKTQNETIQNIKNVNNNSDAKNKMVDQRLNVSILDDNQGILDLFKEYFKKRNISVNCYLTMSSLRESLIKNTRTDLVIIDYNLKEGINGNTVIKVLNSILPKVPKVIMSGEFTVEMLYSAINRGAIGAIKKPFSELDLDEIIKKTELIRNQNTQNELLENLVNSSSNITVDQIKTILNRKVL